MPRFVLLFHEIVPADDQLDSSTGGSTSGPNDRELAGRSLDGRSLDGRSLDGRSLVGRDPNERGDHYDLMLEDDGVLLTWSLQEIPGQRAELPALELPDHRIDYLDYEGPVSRQRGHVARIDRGQFDWMERSELRFVVRISGATLKGRLSITRSAVNDQRWRLSLEE